MQIGDVVVDENGIRWVIVGITYQQGKQVASKVRVGSLAADVYGFSDKK